MVCMKLFSVFYKPIYLYKLYRESRDYSSSKSIERRALANIRYTFSLIKKRLPSSVYKIDYSVLKKARSIEDAVTKLEPTTPEHYLKHIDEYNNWINNMSKLVTNIVLSSGTIGKPKIIAYTIHDAYRNLLVILRCIKYLYPDSSLRDLVLFVEFNTVYPGASASLTTSFARVANSIIIPLYVRDVVDDIILFVKKYISQK